MKEPKPNKTKKIPQPLTQREKFIQTAKKLGCEGGDESYNDVLSEVAKQSPERGPKDDA